jgi:two-component system, OmpR family, sensor histidine kinase CpxA
MKVFTRSLFLKIFLWFWMTAVTTAIALILTFMFQRGSVPSRWREMLGNLARHSGAIAVAEMERGGVPAASSYLGQLNKEANLRACLFDGMGAAITGESCASFKDMAQDVAASRTASMRIKFGIARTAVMLTGRDGRNYVFATELPAGPRAAFGVNRFSFLLQWGVALFVSGLICYLLARYLTAPILRLREATQRLATGELSTRAAPAMVQRNDELGELVRDFNAMASRIEELVSGQKQLIYDVSHELRSPLARLNVALDLARERKGNDPALDHMEQDLERLSEMIGRLLTIARLDASSTPIGLAPVQLDDLVSKIIRDAEFESRKREIGIKLVSNGEHWVHGNAELLYSAIENIIRNAIHYTDSATAVEVRIEGKDVAGASSVHLIVRDYGPGVPESELMNIFRAFYRINDARDRQSGGAGLGLAIAERVIKLHRGIIRAENAVPRGLRIEIILPRILQIEDRKS